MPGSGNPVASNRVDKTVVKAINLLETLAGSRDPVGVTELGKQLGLTKSNTHRILQTWLHLGYVQVCPHSGKYKMSLKIWEVSNQVIDQLNLRDIALPYMRDLLQKFNETVHLSVLDGAEVIYIEKLDSNQPVRAYSSIGGRAPAYCVATGKVQLAFESDEVLTEISKNIQPFTPNTLNDLQSLSKEMEKIRKNGYSLNLGEWRSSVCGLAAPIRVRSGVVAAIGISGPMERLKKKTLTSFAPDIIEAADKISRQLGYLQ